MRGGRRVVLFQRDENFSVHRSDRRRIAQRDIDAAIGQADIVEHRIDLIVAHDFADRAFDLGELALGFLNPGCRRGTHMQPHLTGVDLRKKVPSEQGKERQRANHQDAEKTGQ